MGEAGRARRGTAGQISLPAESTGLPPFRRQSYISAYGEEWALYTERLGDEVGFYRTPYERFGMLSCQMWRAARLVIDTGIPAKGWTRPQALAFLRDNTALSEQEVTTEVGRHMTWPGQALSYYLGQLAIQRARARAEAALGARFDVRSFHDTVLSLGSVPLPVLEAAVTRWVEAGGPSLSPSGAHRVNSAPRCSGHAGGMSDPMRVAERSEVGRGAGARR